MSKFSSTKVKARAKTKTVNVAGGIAFKETNKLEFASTLLTSFLNDKFYESQSETPTRIIGLLEGLKDKKFAAQAAIFARNEFGMRSVTHLVAGEIARLVKGESWTKDFVYNVVHRADDITEILAYYLNTHGKPLPNALKKGLAKAFEKFNEYQLAKYKGESHEFSLVDAANLVHPRPNELNRKALKKLIDGTLKATDTWENELSEAGHKAKNEEEKTKLKKQVWVNLIRERKIGYFALLRNLRNILQQAPEILDEALELLIDETLIQKSLVLPFRYTTAYQEIEELGDAGVKKVIKALNTAVDVATKNCPKMKGDTLVVLDCSGSMEGKPIDIGALFSAILVKNNDADFMLFSEDAKYVSLNSSDSVITLRDKIKSKCSMGGTNFHAPFLVANKKYDRIIILSDMQGWMKGGEPSRAFASYRSKYGAAPKVFSFNLNDYGTLMFPEKDVFCLAGFSEKVFDIIRLLEKDKEALVHEIEKIIL